VALAVALPAGPALAQAPVLHERLPVGAGAGTPAPDLEALAEEAETPGDPPFWDDDGAAPGDAPAGFAVDAVPRLSPPGDVRLDGDTGRDDVLTYFAVFDPSVAPFKRSYVRDRLREDGALAVSEGPLVPLPAERRRARPDREVFWGSLLVELSDGRPVPIPSVAAGGAVLELETVPALPVELLVDSADNLYLRSDATGRVRLNVLMDAPSSWFGGPLPGGVRLGDLPTDAAAGLPPAFAASARAVFGAIRGARGRPPLPLAEVDLAEALTDLVGHFRAFEPGQLEDVPTEPLERFRRIALGGRGVCRHRAYAFVVIAQSLGLRTRYVANEAHAFAEVDLPHVGWRRIDLGGGAAGFDVRGASHRAPHVPDRPDPLPRPPAYASSYSAPALPPTGPAAPGRRRTFRTTDDPGAPADGDAPTVGGEPGAVPTLLTLDRSVAHVFRGEPLPVAGRLRTPAGSVPSSGLAVEVHLLPLASAATERAGTRLGAAVTGADGRFEATLRVPEHVRPGRYRLVARYLGDDLRAPSTSP
jgi:hypothetical protein